MISLNENSIKMLCEGIASHFGPTCEVVFHDLTREYDHTIVAIANGNITHRTVGGPGTNAGLSALMNTHPDSNCETYLNHTPDGKLLKSTSMYFRNEEGQIVASLCINQDISDLVCVQNSLNAFLNTTNEGHECFANDISGILDSMIEDAIARMGKPVIRLSRKEKMEIIRLLDTNGAFLVKRSVERVCEKLNISKNSFYTYLEVNRQKPVSVQR